MKKLISGFFVIALCFAGNAYAYQYGSGLNERDLEMGQYSIDGRSDTGLRFDGNNDGTDDMTLEASGRLTLGAVSYPATDGTANYVLATDGAGTISWAAAGSGGAPTTADYLVGTANGSLSAEIVVGTSPGGELGGTWASPTLDDSVAVTSWNLTTPTITTSLTTSTPTTISAAELDRLDGLAGTIVTTSAGTAPLATALAANPTNCSAGNYPLGIDASGNVESCTSAGGGIDLTADVVKTSNGANSFYIDTAASLTGANNNFAGLTAGDSITSGARNTLFGDNAGTSITTISDSTIVGYAAGDVVVAGYNTLIGSGAGGAITSGEVNTALGYAAGDAIVTGSYHVCIGTGSCGAMTSGVNASNIAIGRSALNVATSASGNIAIGENAGSSVSTSGNGNILIGLFAGDTITSGEYNTIIGGDAADVSSGTVSYSIGLGAGARVTANNQMVVGGSYSERVSDIYFGAGVTNSSASSIGSIKINASGGSGTDNVGANTIIASGKSTGAATPAYVSLQTANPTTTGTTLQTLADKLMIKHDRMSVKISSSAAPGTPALGDMYVDTDSNELCFYTGSAWVGLVAAGACA